MAFILTIRSKKYKTMAFLVKQKTKNDTIKK